MQDGSVDAAEEEPRRASGTWDGQPSPTPDGVRAPGGLPPPPPAPHTGSAVAPATARRGDLRPALPGGHVALPGRAFEVALQHAAPTTRPRSKAHSNPSSRTSEFIKEKKRLPEGSPCPCRNSGRGVGGRSASPQGPLPSGGRCLGCSVPSAAPGLVSSGVTFLFKPGGSIPGRTDVPSRGHGRLGFDAGRDRQWRQTDPERPPPAL